MDCLYFKTNKFQYYFLDECIYYFFEGTKNQSIVTDYVGETGFHELRRRIECFESQLCIKVIGEKENLGDDFINKRKQLFERLMIWTGSIYFDAFGYRGIMEYCIFKKMYDALKTMAY
jgi:hypothetical protein